jgi:hypothetical protein
MSERIELARISATWLPPMAVLLWWMLKLNCENRDFGKSLLIHKWYSNLWFVISVICLWTVMVEIVITRLTGD